MTYNEELQSNNAELEEILQAANELPEAIEDAVRYDTAQSLTAEQQAQARANIGAAAGGESGGTGGTVQADWNQTDETAADFIKNKPFGEKEEIVEAFCGESTSLSDIGFFCHVNYDFVLPQYADIPDISYFSYDGVEYSLSFEAVESLGGSLMAGNKSKLNRLFGTEFEDTGEPAALLLMETLIVVDDVTASTTHTILCELKGTTIQKIDEAYLPVAVGKSTEGDIYIIDGEEVTAAVGAETFNDHENNIASGQNSHAEGSGTIASGQNSHAEGWKTIASGQNSHAEGWKTIASGSFSHAEGTSTTASKINSHAEGSGTIASGQNSHAEGLSTIAAGADQHVQGKYNIEDVDGKYAHIVGNGQVRFGEPVRSNAHTIDWDGNAWFTGTVEGKALILTSSTEGSTKRFKITVDDNGNLTATEATT